MKSWQRYSEYQDSGIEWLGEIPKHWNICQLRRIVSKFVDYRGATPEKVSQGIPLITAKNIKNGTIDFSVSQEFIKEQDYHSWMVRGFPKIGDVIITTEAPLGQSAQIIDENIALAQRVILIKSRINQVNNDYLKYHFVSQFGKGELWSKATGSTALGIKASHFKATLVLVPPLPEQKAIAHFLDCETSKLDTLIAKKQRFIELLQEKRTALISHAVTKGLNPDVPMKDSGIEWLGQIPKHWEVKKLKYLITEPLKYGANESAELNNKDCPRFIRITDISEDGTLREETFRSLPHDIAKPFILKAGDILFARSGATVGKTFMYSEHWGIACHAGYLIRARLKTSKAIPEFISYFANSSVYWDWISSIFIQATIQNVSAEKYANLSLAIPPLSEQKAIAHFLDQETAKIDTLIDKTKISIEKLKEYRTALISAAVTGKIDIREEVA